MQDVQTLLTRYIEIGFDVIVTDDGRIRNVYGFTDVGPAA